MEILNKIEDNFRNMVKTKEVDLSVIGILKKLKSDLIGSKTRFSGKKQILKDFPIFYAIETQIRVLDKMISRIPIAHKMHDNPIVADDALFVMPQFRSVQNILKSKEKSDSHLIMDVSSKLQILAMKHNMYPSQEQITKSVNKKNLKDNLNRFVTNVGEEIERI